MATLTTALWKGTQQEALVLIDTVGRNCTCELGLMGVRLTTCSVHRMLREEQRTLDGLLFARYMAERWRREEFCVADDGTEMVGDADQWS